MGQLEAKDVAQSHWQQYKDTLKEFNSYHADALPLCAAETSMTDFAKLPLKSSLQERYINGSVLKHTYDDNFVGSENLFPLYENISSLCKYIFNADYEDARPLSGMNATTTVLLSSLNIGDRVAMLYPSGGGHDSFVTIVERLGFVVFEVPFNYESMQIDSSLLSRLVRDKNIKAVLLAPSDIIKSPPLDSLDIGDALLIYDATQTLGLIASGHIPNPLEQVENIVMVGGTHKTLPGPTCGLILTNSEKIFQRIDSQGGIYVRNPQPHQIASLILTLIEFIVVGYDYMEQVIKNTNLLAKNLEDLKFNVLKSKLLPLGMWSETHQLFIHCNPDEALNLERNSIRYGVTLNRKSKAIFNNSGIRLGLQEVTRMGWKEGSIPKIAEILNLLSQPSSSESSIFKLMSELPEKNPNYYSFTPE